jgi:flavin reductase (DIM6/NTAB) family NADH-FMN oxidoreductase RutF
MARKRKAKGPPSESDKSTIKRQAKERPNETEPPSKDAQSTAPFEPYPANRVFRLIEPGPVLLATTGSLEDGTHNVMTLGFHMVIRHEDPPLLGISLGPWDASFALLEKHRECVLAVPSAEMAAVAVDVGNCSADDGGGLNKWERFGLEALPAGRVKAPLVGGADVIANIECVVEDTKMVGKYALWVLRAVAAWMNPERRPGEGGRMFHHRGDGTFVVDGEVLDLKHQMVKWQEFQD